MIESTSIKSETSNPISRNQLTAESFEHLLRALGEDDRAGAEYERLRIRLCRFFEWRGSSDAARLADDTLDRVARNLAEGVEVRDLGKFVGGVARNVLLESYDNSEREGRKLAEFARVESAESVDEDERVPCFRECLDELPEADSRILIDYYDQSRETKIRRRKEIARGAGETTNALRIRVHRIRKSLEKCIDECNKRPL